jgi:H+/Cl- antiporter ClcA
VFALEVQRVGRVRYEALVPAFVASFVGDAVVRQLGIDHTYFPTIANVSLTPTLTWQIALFGFIAGGIAWCFSQVTHLVRDTLKKYVMWYPLRPMIGGVVLAVLVLFCDWRDYQGLSFQLASQAFEGSAAGQWITKLLLTAISIGSGFVGGEVIPLFVIGALAGASFAHIIGANVALFAIIGSVAVLAGAANTPLACTFLGLELFGGNSIMLFALVCAAAYATSGHTGIYHAQRVSAPKTLR